MFTGRYPQTSLYRVVRPPAAPDEQVDCVSQEFRVRRLMVICVLVVLIIYSFPYLATSIVLKSKQIPFSFAADLSLYLNLSKSTSSHTDPYFGASISSSQLGYGTFIAAFKLFGLLEKVVDNDLWWAVFIWNLFWWALLCIGTLWFLKEALPKEQTLTFWLGMSLVFFFNFGVFKSLCLAWLHLPSLSGFDGLSLPFIRTFFPQIPIALLALYAAFQVRALRDWRLLDWAWMALLQAAAFATFPYAMLMMAGATAVGGLAELAVERHRKHLFILLGYAVACGMIDAAFLLRMSGGGGHPMSPLIGFHPERAVGLFGGGLLLLMLLTIATAILPAVGSRITKWTIAGVGIANTLLMLGDVVFSPMLLVSHHGAYFQHFTTSLQVVYLVAGMFVRFENRSQWIKTACLVGIVVITMNGVLLAFSGYRYSLPQNSERNRLASALKPLDLTNDDLVIARAVTVDDECSWAPIFTPAKVLFCRSAIYQLSAEQRRSLYRLRQAFYLYFAGDASEKIKQLANPGHNFGKQDLAELDRLAFSGELDPNDQERGKKDSELVQSELVQVLAQVEQADGHVQAPFAPHQRVLVVDDPKKPAFVVERLSRYLSVESEIRSNDFVLLWCRAN